MSIILKFPLERVNRRLHDTSKTSHNAVILVFEGVRYEKTQAPKKLLKQKKSTKRKATIKS